jgi:hypothetical protein
MNIAFNSRPIKIKKSIIKNNIIQMPTPRPQFPPPPPSSLLYELFCGFSKK